jgi:hypothetical protein
MNHEDVENQVRRLQSSRRMYTWSQTPDPSELSLDSLSQPNKARLGLKDGYYVASAKGFSKNFTSPGEAVQYIARMLRCSITDIEELDGN